MRIGIDFDNTIAGYDRLFATLAVEAGLMAEAPIGGKPAVRDALRRQGPDGEVAWQRLQALAYGPRMAGAGMIDGVARFLQAGRRHGATMFIVSHKTRYARRDEEHHADMRQAALDWMDRHGFFADDGFAFARGHVFFEDTRDAKLARIQALACTHFVDDLEELLRDPAFPPGVERCLLAPEAAGDTPPAADRPFHVSRSWHALCDRLFPPAG